MTEVSAGLDSLGMREAFAALPDQIADAVERSRGIPDLPTRDDCLDAERLTNGDAAGGFVWIRNVTGVAIDQSMFSASPAATGGNLGSSFGSATRCSAARNVDRQSRTANRTRAARTGRRLINNLIDNLSTQLS